MRCPLLHFPTTGCYYRTTQATGTFTNATGTLAYPDSAGLSWHQTSGFSDTTPFVCDPFEPNTVTMNFKVATGSGTGVTVTTF
jgi:hypothetical protein